MNVTPVKEQNGVWPYRVVEPDRITYFAKKPVAWDFWTDLAFEPERAKQATLEVRVNRNDVVSYREGVDYRHWIPMQEAEAYKAEAAK